MSFSATREQHGDGAYVVSFDGRLDMTSAGQLKKLLFDLVAAGADTIAVDLWTATAVDSTAVGVLIVTDHALRRSGGRLRVKSGRHHHEALGHLVDEADGIRGKNGSRQGSG
jgi:anti-anti-sigma factor